MTLTSSLFALWISLAVPFSECFQMHGTKCVGKQWYRNTVLPQITWAEGPWQSPGHRQKGQASAPGRTGLHGQASEPGTSFLKEARVRSSHCEEGAPQLRNNNEDNSSHIASPYTLSPEPLCMLFLLRLPFQRDWRPGIGNTGTNFRPPLWIQSWVFYGFPPPSLTFHL